MLYPLNMIKRNLYRSFFLLFSITGTASALPEQTQPPLSLQLMEVSFTLQNPAGQSEPVRQAIIGHFSTSDYPVVDLSNRNGENPVALLSKQVDYGKNGQFNKLVELALPETKAEMAARINSSPEVREVIVEWYKSVEKISIAGMWLESPNLLIMYVQVNNQQMMPYVFAYDQKWYLWSGHLDSPFAQKLDNLYWGNGTSPLQVTPITNLAPFEENPQLVQFARDLGVALPE